MVKNKIIYCRCAYNSLITEESRELFREILQSSKKEILILDDLCALAAKKNNELIDFVNKGEIIIIACHPRAVKWLLFRAEIEMDKLDSFHYLNMMKYPFSELCEKAGVEIPQQYKTAIEGIPPVLDNNSDDLSEESASFEKAYALQNSKQSTRPWFPVIDYSRCTKCGACQDFCLFGVYGKKEDGAIDVAHPFNCKDNCPACARICPHNAIIFPKYNKAPVNGDLEEVAEDAPHKTPIFALSPEELYKALSKRNKKPAKGLYKKEN